MKEVFALYDSRYLSDADRATCYSVCDDLREAIKEKAESFTDAVIVKETLQKRPRKGDDSFEVIKSEIIE